MSANIEPTLEEFDTAIRRRFVLVPWDVIIPTKERVVPLELYVSSLLRDGGASGILNWALDGLYDLIGNNWRLEPPQEAVDATSEYVSNEDRVSRFFKDWFEDSLLANQLNTKQLRKYFAAWMEESDKYVMSAHSFTKECRRIFGKKRCHVGHGRFHIVDGLQLSARGQDEYAERERNLFFKKGE